MIRFFKRFFRTIIVYLYTLYVFVTHITKISEYRSKHAYGNLKKWENYWKNKTESSSL